MNYKTSYKMTAKVMTDSLEWQTHVLLQMLLSQLNSSEENQNLQV